MLKNLCAVLFTVLISCNTFFCTRVFAEELNGDHQLQNRKQKKYTSPVSYYIHPFFGNDANSGTSKQQPFKTLERIEKIKLNPGDSIILAVNLEYKGSLHLVNQQGDAENPIKVTSITWGEEDQNIPAVINFKSRANGILIQDCSFIDISNIRLTGNGFDNINEESGMRCAVLINNINALKMTGIRLDHLFIKDVYYENAGFLRGKNEVHSANGTQKYGWGIRVINNVDGHLIENVEISNCQIFDVSHTGIKLTGIRKNIREVKIANNNLGNTGGPGIQMSEVQFVYVANNVVDHSGSNNDSRKWGRGSGLWTWGASDVLIEKNKFLHANGPGDSDGAHIDYNCENVIIQYNFSAYNAGGFCEILGNNYNCTYRYNISVNDGHRIKGENGAFQEGKTLWLSGFQGEKQKRKGPVNTYIYNNTIYADASLRPKIAFDNTSNGVLIANNIFYTIYPFEMVLGDQYKPDVKTDRRINKMLLKNNLFLNVKSWPQQMAIYEGKDFFGDPNFKTPGGLKLQDYMPLNFEVVRNKGVKISDLKIDEAGLPYSMQLAKDILGNQVSDQPSIGAIEPNF